MVKGREVVVDVFIPVYGEDVAVIRKTAVAALAVHGRHRTWILDDGRSDEVKALAAELGCSYIRRLSGGGAKAGNINHALAIVKGDFFAVFDADFVPRPDFLLETVPFFVDDHGRLRADPAGLRQPAQPDLARRRLHADRVLQVRAGRPQPLQRGLLRGHQRHLPARRGRRRRRHLHRLEVRGRVDLADAARAGLAHRSTSPRRWRSGTRRRPSRPTPSSSCAGRPAASRSCSPTTRSARAVG